MLAGFTGEPTSSAPPSTDNRIAINNAFNCLLCRRRFKTAEKLQRHIDHSTLHKGNLAKVQEKAANKSNLAKPTSNSPCSETERDSSSISDRSTSKGKKLHENAVPHSELCSSTDSSIHVSSADHKSLTCDFNPRGLKSIQSPPNSLMNVHNSDGMDMSRMASCNKITRSTDKNSCIGTSARIKTDPEISQGTCKIGENMPHWNIPQAASARLAGSLDGISMMKDDARLNNCDECSVSSKQSLFVDNFFQNVCNRLSSLDFNKSSSFCKQLEFHSQSDHAFDGADFSFSNPQILWKCAHCETASFSNVFDVFNHEHNCIVSNNNQKIMKDETLLGDLLCGRRKISLFNTLTLENVEIFQERDSEVKINSTGSYHNDRHKKFGKLGIRCVWCKKLPANQRAQFSSCFPQDIKSAVSHLNTMGKKHWNNCEEAPMILGHKLKRSITDSDTGDIELSEYMDVFGKIFGLEETDAGIFASTTIPSPNRSFSLQIWDSPSISSNSPIMKSDGDDLYRNNENSHSLNKTCVPECAKFTIPKFCTGPKNGSRRKAGLNITDGHRKRKFSVDTINH